MFKNNKANGAPRVAPLYVKSSDILKMFDISRRTLARWINKGCPCRNANPEAKSFRERRLYFDPKKVLAWFESYTEIR